MNDERLQSVLEEGFRAMDTTPEDVPRSTRRVMERKARVRQRSRWWPIPVLYRRVKTPTITTTTDYQPAPIPATNGRSGAVTGRTQSMLSPAKAITAGVIVFALGGVLLVAQPFDQPSGAPGAGTEEFFAPVEVTGTMSGSPGAGCRTTNKVGPYEDSGANASLFTCNLETGVTWSFSDPRLEGTVTRINEEVTFAVGDVSDVYVNSTAFSIENDGGAWRERPRTWLLPDGAWTFDWLPQEVLVLDGSGEYEGLVAVLRTTGGLADFRGFIIDARWMPPPRENAAKD